MKIKREGFGYGAGDWKQQECDESFARQELEADGKIFDLTLEGSIDYSLEAWGFETLGENNLQKAADLQLARKLDRLPERPDEKQVETLYSLVQCLYGKG